jgi:hypothetical protein
VKLDALLRAHGFMKVERPPELWEAGTEDTAFIPLLGEMIVACLVRGAKLEELTLNASNVVVDPQSVAPPPGQYVAVTVRGAVFWEAEAAWLPDQPWHIAGLDDLSARLVPAAVRYAYIRKMAPQGSITVFLPVPN